MGIATRCRMNCHAYQTALPWLALATLCLGCGSEVTASPADLARATQAVECAVSFGEPEALLSRDFSVGPLVAGERGLYFGSSDGLEMLGPDNEWLGVLSDTEVQQLVVTEGDRLYFTSGWDASWIHMLDPRAAMNDKTTLHMTGDEISALAIADGELYWGTRSQGAWEGPAASLWRLDLDSDEVESWVTLEDSGRVRGIHPTSDGALLVSHGHSSDPHGSWHLETVHPDGTVAPERLHEASRRGIPVAVHGEAVAWAATHTESGLEAASIFSSKGDATPRLVAGSVDDPDVRWLGHGGDVVYSAGELGITAHCLATGSQTPSEPIGWSSDYALTEAGVYFVTSGDIVSTLYFMPIDRRPACDGQC
jgi:hypothetical protein